MGLLDQLGGSLKNVVGSLAAAEGPAVLSALLAKTNLGSLQGLVDQLQHEHSAHCHGPEHPGFNPRGLVHALYRG